MTVNYAVAVTLPGAGTPTGNVTVSHGPHRTYVARYCSITLNTACARTSTSTTPCDDGNHWQHPVGASLTR